MSTTAFGSSIAGRQAVVTGAGNGLGLAIAKALAGAGADIVLAGRDLDKLQQAAATLPAPSRRRPEVVDVTDPQSANALAQRLGTDDVSILVNNAGIPGPVSPLWEISSEDWDQVFDVNVRGTYLMCKAFLPAMIRAGRGDIVNIASVTGKRPLTNRTPYAASKMAVIGLTTTLANEVGPLGINANTVSPGPVAGPRMTRNFHLEAERTGTSPEEAEQAFVSRSALGRMVTEDEVASAVLAVLAMPGLTGADIDLSGGMVAR